MGLQADLELVDSFFYHTSAENNLTEHELDYVFIGYSDQNPLPNDYEVQEY